MRRLVTAGLLPERAGQPVKAVVHISLADLMRLDGSSALLQEWTAGSGRSGPGTAPAPPPAAGRRGLAGRRRRRSRRVRRGDGPVRHRRRGPGRAGGSGPAVRPARPAPPPPPRRRRRPAPAASDDSTGGAGTGQRRRHRRRARQHRRRVRQHRRRPGRGRPGHRPGLGGPRTRDHRQGRGPLSGPGGLASFLRRRQLGARLGGPSLPLDIGFSQSVPAGIRNAVTLRDQHCRWAGGCHQPASACEVHHVKHKKNGGKTSTKDCVLLCFFHHQIVIHKWGWTLVLNPDGTTTAWNPGQNEGAAQPQPTREPRVTTPGYGGQPEVRRRRLPSARRR